VSSYFGVGVVLRLGIALGPRWDVSEVDLWTQFPGFWGSYMSAQSKGSCRTTGQCSEPYVSETVLGEEYNV